MLEFIYSYSINRKKMEENSWKNDWFLDFVPVKLIFCWYVCWSSIQEWRIFKQLVKYKKMSDISEFRYFLSRLDIFKRILYPHKLKKTITSYVVVAKQNHFFLNQNSLLTLWYLFLELFVLFFSFIPTILITSNIYHKNVHKSPFHFLI